MVELGWNDMDVARWKLEDVGMEPQTEGGPKSLSVTEPAVFDTNGPSIKKMKMDESHGTPRGIGTKFTSKRRF